MVGICLIRQGGFKVGLGWAQAWLGWVLNGLALVLGCRVEGGFWAVAGLAESGLGTDLDLG